MTSRPGISLVECFVAIAILAAGLLGGAALVAAATRRAAAAGHGAEALRTALATPLACPAAADSGTVAGVRVTLVPVAPHAVRVVATTRSGRRVTVLRADGCAP